MEIGGFSQPSHPLAERIEAGGFNQPIHSPEDRTEEGGSSQLTYPLHDRIEGGSFSQPSHPPVDRKEAGRFCQPSQMADRMHVGSSSKPSHKPEDRMQAGGVNQPSKPPVDRIEAGGFNQPSFPPDNRIQAGDVRQPYYPSVDRIQAGAFIQAPHPPVGGIPPSVGPSPGYFSEHRPLQYGNPGQAAYPNGAPLHRNPYMHGAVPGMGYFGTPYPYLPPVYVAQGVPSCTPAAPFQQAVCMPYDPKETPAAHRSNIKSGFEKDSNVINRHTVEVLGVDNSISLETLEMYFENVRRSGGRGKLEHEDGVYLVTFATANDVTEVLKREHVINGKTLEVKHHDPKKVYRDKVLVSNMNPKTTRDGLQSFLEAKSRCSITDIRYGDSPDSALVTFGKHPDIRVLRKACMEKAIDGKVLVIEEVTVSDKIIIHGIGAKTTEDTITFYFESVRSGNFDGEAVDISFNRRGGYCIVCFGNYNVAAHVLSQSHEIDGAKLSVSLYLDCLGVGDGLIPAWLQETVSFAMDMNKFKVRFIQSTTYMSVIKKELANCQAEITLTSEDTATFKSTASPDTRGAYKSAKEWREKTEATFTKVISAILVKEIHLKAEISKGSLEEMGVESLSLSNDVKTYLSECGSKIIIVGHAERLTEVWEEISSKMKSMEDAPKTGKQVINETLTYLKPLQVQLLQVSDIHTHLMEQFVDLTVHVQQATVVLKGKPDGVKNAKIQLYEKLNTMSSTVLHLSEEKLNFLEQRKVKRYLMDKLKANNLVGVWKIHAQSRNMEILAASEEASLDVVDLIKEEVVEDTVPLSPENLAVLSSSQWMSLVSDIHASQKHLTMVNSSAEGKVVIVTIRSRGTDTKRRVQDFLEMNTILSEKLSISEPIYRFLLKHSETSISAIAEKHHVLLEYKVNVPHITVSGCLKSLQNATNDLETLQKSIKRRTYILSRRWMSKLMASDIGKKVIEETEMSERCTVDINDVGTSAEFKSENTTGGGSNLPPGLMLFASCQQSETHIHVAMGDITQTRVDVIVNAANQQLHHMGGLADAVSKQEGTAITTESSDNVLKNGEVPAGHAASTGPGELPCKMVVHAVGPLWSGGTSGEENLLKSAVKNSIRLADDGRFKSIAIPAISSGLFQYPSHLATRHIVEAVKLYFVEEGTTTHLKDVYLMDVSLPNVNLVVEAFKGAYSDAVIHLHRDDDSKQETSTNTISYAPLTSDLEMKTGSELQSKSINIKLVRDAIEKHGADVIVNSVCHDLNLQKGGVAKSISSYGGRDMERDLHRLHPDGLSNGEVGVSSGRRLHCSSIYHVCLSTTQVGKMDWRQELQDVVYTCLQKACDAGYSSIAFPALGTGLLGHDPDVVAQIMYSTVMGFESCNTSLTCTLHHFAKGQGCIQDTELPKCHSVSLCIFSDDEKCIDKAVQIFESTCDKNISSKKIQDPALEKMSVSQVQEIQQKHIFVDVVNEILGTVELRGLPADVSEAALHFITVIRSIERTDGESKLAALLTKSVKWCYIDKSESGKERLEFDAKTNAEIENEFEKGKATCVVEVANTTVSIDFVAMTATFNGEKEIVCSLLRKDYFKEASLFELPKTWKPMTDSGNVLVDSLSPYDMEYTDVESLFRSDINPPGFKILKIERIQNRALYQQYTTKKKQLKKQNSPLVQNERRLWHGTSIDSMDSIINHGFNRSYCGKNAALHGDGVYFAVESRYSARNTYSKPDKKKRKYVFLALVLTGDYTNGEREMRVPPKKHRAVTRGNEIYDSVVDDIEKPNMFVIFNDTQAYPEYLITFRQRTSSLVCL